MTGDTSGARVVHIERLTVNVANAGGVVLNINESSILEDVRQKSPNYSKTHAPKGQTAIFFIDIGHTGKIYTAQADPCQGSCV